MKSIGSTLLFFGIGSIVLNVVGYEFVILSWIDFWGETTGWTIRAVMIVAGAGLFFVGRIGDDDPSEAPEEAPRQEPTMRSAPITQSQPATVEPGADPMGSLQNR